MRIAVYGTGGVGGYFGGRLAQAGEEVIFIARGEHLKAMQTNGLRVDSIKGDFLVKPVQAASDPRQVGEVEIVILAVKAWQVPECAQAMLPMIGDMAARDRRGIPGKRRGRDRSTERGFGRASTCWAGAAISRLSSPDRGISSTWASIRGWRSASWTGDSARAWSACARLS